MRYITPHGTLALYDKAGRMQYRFSPYGVLTVGTPACNNNAADRIDASVKTDDSMLMRNFPTDLSGDKISCIEMVGLGCLSCAEYGYRGLFFEAPPIDIDGNTPNDYGLESGWWVQVLRGAITYMGVTYRPYQVFQIVDVGSDFVGVGVLAMALPPSLLGRCDPSLSEHFKIKHLKDGSESRNYYLHDRSGFEPRNSLVSTDDNYIGWTK